MKVPGEYYIYYLKNIMSGSRYYPTVHYMGVEQTASDEWLKKNKLIRMTTDIPYKWVADKPH